jgi:predicted nucleic acid-binding protein
VAALTPVFLDTSILVAGLIEIGDASEFPQKIMTAIAEGRIRRGVTAWHCCLEFYSVATRLPEEFRLAPEDALRLVAEEVLARLDVRQLPEPRWGPFLRALEQDRIAGGRVYDAHIGEIARHADVNAVVTDNRRHFSPLARHGVRVLSAEEFARASHLAR